MSLASTPGPYPSTARLFLLPTAHSESELNRGPSAPTGLALRRRSTFEQGRGLEILGHALEYLVDSRMYLVDEPHTAADTEATAILMRLSRQIFQECAEVISPARRLRLWLADRLRIPSKQT